jgi:speckle-type POZ protein
MSAAGHGGLSRSATRVVAKEANGFHLLRIDGYSQTKTVLPGQKLSSHPFSVGGHTWRVDYYPNGRDVSADHNAISVYLQLVNHTHQHLQVQARYKFSLLDHDGVPAYELPFETGSFTSVPPQYHNGVMVNEEQAGTVFGHEEFIGWEHLETRREDLIREDSIVIRCDVGVTQIVESWLAHEHQDDAEDDEYSEEDGYGYSRRQRRHHRRPDDGEFVRRCLVAQQPGAIGFRR